MYMDTFVAARSVLLMGVNELPKQKTKIDNIEKLRNWEKI